MKLLFISSRDVNTKSYGGAQCTNRNYLSICELIGFENVEVINLNIEVKKSILRGILKRVNLLFGFYYLLSHNKLNMILNTSVKYDHIFIDTSVYGVIAYYLTKQKYQGKIICFFHNVEYNINSQKVKKTSIDFLKKFIVYYNEKTACRYSDKIVALNQRDADELQRLYRVANVKIIPISLLDSFKEVVNEQTSVPPTFLFLGNNWYANIHGLKWFISNVLNHVNIKLQIVGSGMDMLKEEFAHPKIEFLGYVSDLSSVLMNADYFICPIFIGSGMKVKTCEALMYGKNIIGTREAFEGYEIDCTKVGAICNNREEFIYIIKDYCSVKREKFNEYSRNCFLEKYSFQATLIKFEELLHK